MAKSKPIGIDLGTTNSSVAWVDHTGRTAMVPNSEGDILTPSAVLFDDTEVVVGKEARSAAVVHPEKVAECVKRDMGQPVYSRPIRGQYLPPEVIQACVLRKLKSDVVHILGPDTAVVITVPAYFDELRRKATADAGEMAGLSVLDIVNEPTAAALSFGEAAGFLTPSGAPKEELTVMVYDLGGGTFDVTLLKLATRDIRTIATDGDVQLGGHDFDLRLLDHVAETYKAQYGADPRETPAGFNRLLASCVEAKHTLSARTKAKVRVDHGGRASEIEVTREKFEELTGDLLERTSYTCRQLLAAAKMSWPQVHRVLLVGGSTRMPMVSRMLQQLSGLQPDHTVNPDEAVARGAALYASYVLSKRPDGGGRPSFEVTNVNAHSLGVEGIDPDTLRKTNVILIPRNTPLPARFTEKFVTKSEGQRSIVVQVLEGESSLPSECTPIGRTVIRDLPGGLPKGWPVEVTFEYATNGRLAVHAVVPGTHREVQLALERDTGMTLEGIARWRQTMAGAPGFDAFEALLADVLHLGPAPGGQAPAPAPHGGWDSGPAAGGGLAAGPSPLSAPTPLSAPSPLSAPAPLSGPMPLSAPSPPGGSPGMASSPGLASGPYQPAAVAGPAPAAPAGASGGYAQGSIPLAPQPGAAYGQSAAQPAGPTGGLRPELTATATWGAVPGTGQAAAMAPTPASGPPRPPEPPPPPNPAPPSNSNVAEAAQAEAARGRNWTVTIVGHVMAAIIGLGMGYLVLHFLRPESFPFPWE